MKLKLFSLAAPLLFSCVTYASAWTGEKAEGMYSDMVINNIHTGVVDSRPYFCIEASKNGANFTGCAVGGYSNWAAGYELFYNQAMYYYATGQLIRIYYQPYHWPNADFNHITPNAIAGFSTCSTVEHCFGPSRQAGQ